MTKLVDINPYEDTVHALQKVQLNTQITNNFMSKIENSFVSKTESEAEKEITTRFVVPESRHVSVYIKDHATWRHQEPGNLVMEMTNGSNLSGNLVSIKPSVYDNKRGIYLYDNEYRYYATISTRFLDDNPFSANDSITHIGVSNVGEGNPTVPGGSISLSWGFEATAPLPSTFPASSLLTVHTQFYYGQELGWKDIGKTSVYLDVIPGPSTGQDDPLKALLVQPIIQVPVYARLDYRYAGHWTWTQTDTNGFIGPWPFSVFDTVTKEVHCETNASTRFYFQIRNIEIIDTNICSDTSSNGKVKVELLGEGERNVFRLWWDRNTSISYDLLTSGSGLSTLARAPHFKYDVYAKPVSGDSDYVKIGTQYVQLVFMQAQPAT